LSGAEIIRLAARLSDRGRSYALATVVARQAPSSSLVGQKALIETDGSFHGWLGGSCVEPIVLKEALQALADGEPRLIVLSPDARSDRPGAIVHLMTCHSGGTVEIYLEPQHPAACLILFGDSPVTHALAELGERAGYRVRTCTEPASSEATAAAAGGEAPLYAVVATLGEWDVAAMEAALRAGARYVGLIASPRRADELRRRLLAHDWAEHELAPLVGPAGLDIGAREPVEIAISILAELIARRTAAAEEPVAESAAAIDPVCGMEVRIEDARFVLELEDRTYYFCCEGCKERFARDAAAVE
jgi:xanthine dehydrogenase accessory factor